MSIDYSPSNSASTVFRWDIETLRLYAELDERQNRLRLRDHLHAAYGLQAEIEFTNDSELKAMVSRYVKFCDRGYCEASGLEYRSHE
jgi:hypothetical protein